MATTASVYNYSRLTRQILKKNRKHTPSLTLHLHPTWFRFEDAKGRLIFEEPVSPPDLPGPSTYRAPRVMTPGKELLRCIRDHKLPDDVLSVLDARRTPFYDGCLIVEIKDHRRPIRVEPSRITKIDTRPSGPDDSIDPKSLAARIEGGRYGHGPAYRLAQEQVALKQDKADSAKSDQTQGPEVYRVVLFPSDETLWVDLKNLNDKRSGGTWTEEEGLHIESKILSLTSAPLCLDPDPHATKMANLILAATAPASRYIPSPTSSLSHQRIFPPLEPIVPPIEKPETEQDRAAKKEQERELFEAGRRQALMKLMEGGWKGQTLDKKPSIKANVAASRSSTPLTPAAAPAPSPAPQPGPQPGPPLADDSPIFIPTFRRLQFIESVRAKRNPQSVEHPQEEDGAESSGQPHSDGNKKDSTTASGSNSTGASKKAISKKRKKADEAAAAAAAAAEKEAEEEEEEASAPKSKKKKKNNKASSPPAPEPNGKKKETTASATSPDKKARPKAKPKKSAAAAKKEAEEAAAAAANGGDAGSPNDTNDEADTSGPINSKGGKKLPAGKRTPSKAAKKTTAANNSANRQSSSATPSLRAAQLPGGQGASPSRHHGASPYNNGAPNGLNMTTPSPAMSHQGIPPNNYANSLPLGVGLPLSSPNQNHLTNHHYGLPLGSNATNSPQQQQPQSNMGIPGGLNLPFAPGQGASNSQPNFNFNHQQPNFNIPQPQQQQQQPQINFAQLPAHLHQQYFAWQQQQQQQQQQAQHQQQQQQQMNQQNAGNNPAQQAGNRFPPGWPVAQ
ncbi:unnamed protein product [Sympodiomycopsis kandeliae]